MSPDEKPLNAAEPTPPAAEADPAAEKTPAEIRAEIDETREELGDTVEALAGKTDVKAQVQARARRDPKPFAIAGGVIVLFLLWRRRRS